MTPLQFQAEAIIRDGALAIKDPMRWRASLAGHEGERIIVTVEREGTRRTSRQNRWYWGTIVPMVAAYLSRGRELELHSTQAHYVLKCAFLGVVETPLGVAPLRSHRLTTKEFSDYCDQIVAHAASDWALHIPQPNEGMEVAI